MLKIEDLKVSDELVCIDLKSMEKAWENASDLWRKAKIDVLKISHINVEGGLVHFQDGKFYLECHELKYFKKKEQSQYTFDDLTDVARQAFDDEMLRHLSQSIDPVKELKITTQDGVCIEWVDNLNDYLPSINFIQSLYKEIFVIESEEDIKRVKDGAKITLVNDNESYVCALNDPADSFCVLHSDYNLDMFTLKGATVEQSRNV